MAIKKINNETMRTVREALEKCVICGKPIAGFGNNAQPVKDGRCCDLCNATVVIPARFDAVKKNKDRAKVECKLTESTNGMLGSESVICSVFDTDDEKGIEGCAVIMKAGSLSSNYQKPEYQFFKAETGFGCRPNTSGNAVYGHFLADGEECRVERYSILGVAKEEVLKKYFPDAEFVMPKLASSVNDAVTTNNTSVNSIRDEVLAVFKAHNIDITDAGVKEYALHAAEYIKDVRDDGEEYTVQQWYKDTDTTYPEDIADLKKVEESTTKLTYNVVLEYEDGYGKHKRCFRECADSKDTAVKGVISKLNFSAEQDDNLVRGVTLISTEESKQRKGLKESENSSELGAKTHDYELVNIDEELDRFEQFESSASIFQEHLRYIVRNIRKATEGMRTDKEQDAINKLVELDHELDNGLLQWGSALQSCYMALDSLTDDQTSVQEESVMRFTDGNNEHTVTFGITEQDNQKWYHAKIDDNESIELGVSTISEAVEAAKTECEALYKEVKWL